MPNPGVRAGNGVIDPNEMQMMCDLLPQAETVELPEAKHDLHLDQPERWREIVLRFLRTTST